MRNVNHAYEGREKGGRHGGRGGVGVGGGEGKRGRKDGRKEGERNKEERRGEEKGKEQTLNLVINCFLHHSGTARHNHCYSMKEKKLTLIEHHTQSILLSHIILRTT